MAMRRHDWGTLPFTCPKHHKNHLQTATHPNSTSLLGKILSAPSYSKRGSANTVEHDAALEHDPNAAKLVRAEDDLTAWKEIEVLAKDLDADVAPPAVVEDGKDENLTDACTDTGDQVPTSLPEILDMVGGLPEWQFQSGTSHGEGACLRRVASLLKPIKDFATQVRINEKVLSPAQAQGMKPSDGNNQWNWVVHELAQAQQNSMQSATRISRSSGWFAATQSLCEAVAWQC